MSTNLGSLPPMIKNMLERFTLSQEEKQVLRKALEMDAVSQEVKQALREGLREVLTQCVIFSQKIRQVPYIGDLIVECEDPIAVAIYYMFFFSMPEEFIEIYLHDVGERRDKK